MWKREVSIYRRIAFKKERSCRECKSKKDLQVHHIDQNRNNNYPSNLMILCKSCHEKLHGIVQKKKPNKKYQSGTRKNKRKSL